MNVAHFAHDPTQNSKNAQLFEETLMNLSLYLTKDKNFFGL